jgi:GNAT superfamily N-acetyltransferase
MFVARNHENILGFISIWSEEDFIHHLYVSQSHQKRGIGKALVDVAKRRTSGPLRLKCDRFNTQALAFYRRTGWVEIEHISTSDVPYIVLENNGSVKGVSAASL